MIPETVVSRSLDRIYNRGIDVEREIDPDLFASTWELLNEATDKGFGQRSVDSTDYGFYKELQYNNGVYAAYRVHRCQNDLATAMIGEDKQLKPFDKWTGDVQPMLNHNVGSWLKTEYDTAVIRAHQADDWRRFEAAKDLFPRLEWLPTTSSAPDTVHQAFWGTILPVDHPFWSAHRPGDRWNCKCTLRNTDKAATDVPVVTRDNKPDPGLDCNPGISGKIFADSNPHQKHAYEGADKAVERCVQDQINERMRHLRKEAKHLAGREFEYDAIGTKLSLSNRGIKEWLNQPHKHQFVKNELLLHIDKLLKSSTYVGSGVDKHRVDVIVHLFEVVMQGDKSWIIAREIPNNGTHIHSISDNESILSLIKTKPTK